MEEEILDKLRKMLFHTMEANECGLSNNDFKEDIEALSGMLDLYDKEKQKRQKCENTIKKVLECLDYIDDDMLKTCSNYDVNGIEIVKILKEV